MIVIRDDNEFFLDLDKVFIDLINYIKILALKI